MLLKRERVMSKPTTYREIFQQFADKPVNFGEFYTNYKNELSQLSALDQVRRYAIEVPKGVLKGLFCSKSDQTKSFLNSELYIERDSFGVANSSRVMTRNLMLSILEDSEGSILDKDSSYSEYQTKLAECHVKAWNASKDCSHDIASGKYITLAQKLK